MLLLLCGRSAESESESERVVGQVDETSEWLEWLAEWTSRPSRCVSILNEVLLRCIIQGFCDFIQCVLFLTHSLGYSSTRPLARLLSATRKQMDGTFTQLVLVLVQVHYSGIL